MGGEDMFLAFNLLQKKNGVLSSSKQNILGEKGCFSVCLRVTDNSMFLVFWTLLINNYSTIVLKLHLETLK